MLKSIGMFLVTALLSWCWIQAPATAIANLSFTPLTLEDLPAGFLEPPTIITTPICQQINELTKAISQQSFNPNDCAVLINVRNTNNPQIVMTVTGQIDDIAEFDRALATMSDVQQSNAVISQIQHYLPNKKNLTVSDYRLGQSLPHIGDHWASIQMDMTWKQQRLPTQVVIFREAQAGVMFALSGLDPSAMLISIPTLARTLKITHRAGF